MSNRKTKSETEADILKRVVDPEMATLSPEAARLILALGFNKSDLGRMNLLAAKARSGVLDSVEESTLDNYLRVGRFLALVQAKARRSLQVQTSHAK